MIRPGIEPRWLLLSMLGFAGACTAPGPLGELNGSGGSGGGATSTSAGGGGGAPDLTITWAERKRLPEPDALFVSATLGGQIHLFGLNHSFWHRSFDPITNGWSQLADMPYDASEGAAAVAGTTLYAFGVGSTGAFAALEWNPTTDKWKTRAKNTLVRQRPIAGVIGSKVYLAGGFPAGGQSLQLYDTVTDTWTTLPDLPAGAGLGTPTGAVIGQTIYLFGTGGGFDPDETWAYDVGTAQWTQKASSPLSRDNARAVAADDHRVLVLGGTQNATPTATIQIYDVAADDDAWSTTKLPLPEPMYGFAAEKVGNKIYTFGGYGGNSQPSDRVWEGTLP